MIGKVSCELNFVKILQVNCSKGAVLEDKFPYEFSRN